ncbi:slipin family protein [Alkalibacter saccharofermentans]|uniref:SPFH domain, Band 7 family protein n=1 Tax=Alkalibacter saccharofermentans DSM 14828 TaxID=1120975 RepID=A0A1M4ZAX7_9FIRM|nr:slipin family protein [Alkalibacter saccharofermentans]SHF15118.1 SPFH domain, Band 7 family protein [Alkalibacter saccharofermentans DSM 14828]
MFFLNETVLTVAGVMIVLLFILSMSIKIVLEYERGVLFRLGRLVGVRGPGLILIIPFIDKITRISLRTIVIDVPPQEVITRDNVTCTVNAVLYYRAVAPDKAVVNVERYHDATSQYAQTTLRSVVGQADLDELLSQREKLNKIIQQIVDEATDPWGIKVTAVEIKDVTLPNEMQRAIAKQAEAERNRRAVVIQAEGEKQAAVRLAEATEILSGQEGAMTLRMLRSLSEAADSKSTTILFPLPVELRALLPDPAKIKVKTDAGRRKREEIRRQEKLMEENKIEVDEKLKGEETNEES